MHACMVSGLLPNGHISSHQGAFAFAEDAGMCLEPITSASAHGLHVARCGLAKVACRPISCSLLSFKAHYTSK